MNYIDRNFLDLIGSLTPSFGSEGWSDGFADLPDDSKEIISQLYMKVSEEEIIKYVTEYKNGYEVGSYMSEHADEIYDEDGNEIEDVDLLEPTSNHTFEAKQLLEEYIREFGLARTTHMKEHRELSEYKFLELFLITYIQKGNNPIIEKNDIETKLLKYKDNPEYSFLFSDIALKKDNLTETRKVNLSEAFLNGIAWGLLMVIQNGAINTKYIINVSQDEISKFLENYGEEEKEAMSKMTDELMNENKKVLVKTKQNQ